MNMQVELGTLMQPKAKLEQVKYLTRFHDGFGERPERVEPLETDAVRVTLPSGEVLEFGFSGDHVSVRAVDGQLTINVVEGDLLLSAD